jgi:CRISPR/Cas system-associated endonuclease Cas1
MGQVYRLRGLLVKGWRAVLVLRVVAKLTGYTEEKQLRRLQSDIAEAEAALAILKAQAEDLRKKLDAGTASETQESPAIGN